MGCIRVVAWQNPSSIKTKSELVASTESLVGSLVSSVRPGVWVLGLCTVLDNQLCTQMLQTFKNTTSNFQSGFKSSFMLPVMHMAQ